RTIHALLTNRDPERTFELAEQLPAQIRERIAELSPASVADRLDMPISAMHSTDDSAVPYGELLRLGDALPHATLVTLDGFSHVDLQASSPRSWLAAVDDLWNVWRFATDIVRTQEGWLP
ncbi:MAG: alpha/beta hydrolase family protein, partial [Nitriliruptorales bacterium]